MQSWINLVFPVIVWACYRLVLPNQRWEFDFDQMHGTFNLLLTRYFGLALFMVVVDLVAAAIGRHLHAADGVVACCVFGAFYSFACILWVTIRYEIYLHHRYPKVGVPQESPYTTAQYAVTRALAWSAVTLSVVGVGLVAMG